jgi:phospholipid/cholesterol/gamma-HCH transport system ATP-binding protein
MSIELRDLHKAFGPKKVLQGFTLNIQEGETLSIIGGSGAGKSVTLKHILGLIAPDQGEVWVDGQNVNQLEREQLYELRRKVGYVFQFAALFDSMTIADNVAMGLRRIHGMEESQIQERVSECLRRVDLNGVENLYPNQISGGMQKRVGFARAIATQPRYLLYDEPTTGLDPVTVTVIDRLIMRMADDLGVTGVVITHDMESAYRISDRIAMMHGGRVRTLGTPEEIRSSHDPIVKGFIEGRPELLEKAS